MRRGTHRQQDHTASTKYLFWDAKTLTNWVGVLYFSSIKKSANKCFLLSSCGLPARRTELFLFIKSEQTAVLNHRDKQTDTRPQTETHRSFISRTKPKQSDLNRFISSEIINPTNRCLTFFHGWPNCCTSKHQLLRIHLQQKSQWLVASEEVLFLPCMDVNIVDTIHQQVYINKGYICNCGPKTDNVNKVIRMKTFTILWIILSDLNIIFGKTVFVK